MVIQKIIQGCVWSRELKYIKKMNTLFFFQFKIGQLLDVYGFCFFLFVFPNIKIYFSTVWIMLKYIVKRRWIFWGKGYYWVESQEGKDSFTSIDLGPVTHAFLNFPISNEYYYKTTSKFHMWNKHYQIFVTINNLSNI